MGLSRTVSEISCDFSQKSLISTTPCILLPHWRSSLGIGYRRWDQKN